MATEPGILKKIFWPLVIPAGLIAFLVVPLYRVVPPSGWIYFLGLIPAYLAFVALMLQNDRICSRATTVVFEALSLLCLGLGILLHQYHVFPEKPGFFVVAFGIPLLFVGFSDICRVMYIAWRHETPCINVRSGRWIGDPPVNGFYTTYPPGKLISWADVLFGISQWIVPLVITMVLFIWSLAADW
ncbi:MAG: hypothetical protein JO314_06765 [Acidobacteria bacterium]|nr:hypothetical protein [Acidobacteriota bacterium]